MAAQTKNTENGKGDYATLISPTYPVSPDASGSSAVTTPRMRSRSQHGSEIKQSTKYLGPRMKVLIWNDKTKSFVHIIRCPNGDTFYELRRSYDDFEYLYYLLNNGYTNQDKNKNQNKNENNNNDNNGYGINNNNNNMKNEIDEQLILYTIEKGSKTKHGKHGKRSKSMGFGVNQSKKSLKKRSFLQNNENANGNINGNNNNNSNNKNNNSGLLDEKNESKDETKESSLTTNNCSNVNSIEIPKIPDRISAAKGLFPNVKKLRKEHKQQAIELQVFITKLYFNATLWQNKFVKIFFESTIVSENEFKDKIEKLYENDDTQGVQVTSDWNRQISISRSMSKDPFSK